MPLGTAYPTQNCPVARSLEVVGERWTLLIVRDLFYGVRRFNDFSKHLSIPTAVLSARLEHLIAEGVVVRTPGRAGSAREEYELTPRGESLWPVVWSLIVWGNGEVPTASRRITEHALCGTPLDAAGFCATCGVTPGPRDILLPARDAAGMTDPVSLAMTRPHRLLEPLAV